MTPLAVIRHGPTEWNAIGKVQGRTDVPLSETGRQAVRGWSPPAELDGFTWITSPLARAVETAETLSGGPVPRDDRLVEMDWAEWEARSLDALRRELGDLMTAWEAEGLDFRAPGGESPRDVQHRIAPLLGEIAARGQPTVAVTHKGVIRALYALSTGWDMTGKPREKLNDAHVQIFLLTAGGMPVISRVNIPLAPGESR